MESARATTGIDDFTNDNFSPNIGNLFIDMGDNTYTAFVAAAPYVILPFPFDMLIEFLYLVCVLDLVFSSTILIVCMISLALLLSSCLFVVYLD